MKKLCAILASVLLLSVCAANASAATISSTDILKGSPVIDGYCDEIYTQSACYEYEDSDIGAVYSTYDFTPDHTASVRLLWDDSYLYMFTEVKDTDVVSRGQEYIDENTTSAWANDAAEYWIYADYVYICKVHTDAYGLNFFEHAEGSFGIAEDIFDISASKCKVVITDEGYCAEVALKYADDYKDCFEADCDLGFSLQINDIKDSTGEEIYCSGSQDPTVNVFTLSATEVVPPVEEVVEETPAVEEVVVEEPAEEVVEETIEEAPVVEEVVEETAEEIVEDVPEVEEAIVETVEEAVEEAPVTAPVTADASVAVAAVIMAAAAGFVLSKKH